MVPHISLGLVNDAQMQPQNCKPQQQSGHGINAQIRTITVIDDTSGISIKPKRKKQQENQILIQPKPKSGDVVKP
jgi:hypothetical protein